MSNEDSARPQETERGAACARFFRALVVGDEEQMQRELPELQNHVRAKLQRRFGTPGTPAYSWTDVVQESIWTTFRRLRDENLQIPDAGSFIEFVVTVAIRRTLNAIDRRKRERLANADPAALASIAADDFEMANATAERSLEEAFELILAQFPDSESRQIVELRAGGLPDKEIARRLKLSERTIRRRFKDEIHPILRGLQTKLAEESPEP
jgi:RNA polymerase sigma factor (sigma-70 family)